MTTMKKWYLHNYKGTLRLIGNVIDHPRLPDGLETQATQIVKVERDKEDIILYSLNTVYHLAISDFRIYQDQDFYRGHSYKEEEPLADMVYLFDLLTALEKVSFMMLNFHQEDPFEWIQSHYGNFIEDYDKRTFKKNFLEMSSIFYHKMQKKMEIIDLQNNELYLELDQSNYHFSKGLFKYKDKTCFVKHYVHLGMFADSVLINDREKWRELDFRYFPKNDNINIYSWNESIKKVIFCNSGKSSISIDYNNSINTLFTLLPEEIKSFSRKDISRNL